MYLFIVSLCFEFGKVSSNISLSNVFNSMVKIYFFSNLVFWRNKFKFSCCGISKWQIVFYYILARFILKRSTIATGEYELPEVVFKRVKLLISLNFAMTTKLITLNSVKAIIIGSEVSLERLSQIELWCLHLLCSFATSISLQYLLMKILIYCYLHL